MGQDGLEEGNKRSGFGNWWLKRKVRKLIRVVDILEERLSTNEVSLPERIYNSHYANGVPAMFIS